VRRLTGRIVLLIGVLAGGSAAMGEDPIRAELNRLKGLYAEAVQREKAAVDAAFEAAIKTAAAAGDLDAVQVLTAEREAFGAGGKLPASKSVAEAAQAYQRKKSYFDSTMLDAYGKTIKQYTRQLKIEEAVQIRQQLQDFTKSANAHPAEPIAVPRQADDPILEKLDVAKKRQAEAFEAARKEMAEALDQEIKAQAAKGNLDGVRSTQALKAQFDEEADIRPPANGPLQLAKRRYDHRLIEARDRLTTAYRLAIRECTQSNRSEEAQALEVELLAGVGVGPRRWLVIFRSANPWVWNTNHKSSSGMAMRIDANVPDDVRYVRMRCMETGASVISGISKEALARERVDGPGRLGWTGSKYSLNRVIMLGLFHKDWVATNGTIAVSLWRRSQGNRGWGFGIPISEPHAGQGFSWEGKRFTKPVTFEIAVTAQELTARERKLLLQ